MGETAGWALGVLACWRLTHLLWAEDGPGRLIARWRDRLPRSPDSGLPALVGCFYCLSLWVALPLSGLVVLLTGPEGASLLQGLASLGLGSLGLSGGAITLERALDRPAAGPPDAAPVAAPPAGTGALPPPATAPSGFTTATSEEPLP